jgi:C1A family cysteine protease
MPKDTFKPRKIQGYGYLPDLPDHRDYYYNVSVPVETPPAVDLRPNCPRIVYNQGMLGSCTANALAGLLQYNQIVQKKPIRLMPSRLFIYYNERYLENTVLEDSGATLRDGIRALCKWGAPDENLWPYHLHKFTVEPSPPVYGAAQSSIITQYSRIVQKISDLRVCLASGHPFVMGIMVYDSFESREVATTGIVPMPSRNEDAVGGHAVLTVGYNDAEQRFLVRNSWGPRWGQQGYFTIPYEYILNSDLCGDIWTIKMIP